MVEDTVYLGSVQDAQPFSRGIWKALESEPDLLRIGARMHTHPIVETKRVQSIPNR